MVAVVRETPCKQCCREVAQLQQSVMPTEVEQNVLWVEGEMDGRSLRGETEKD